MKRELYGLLVFLATIEILGVVHNVLALSMRV
jgi:hypothetical protein